MKYSIKLSILLLFFLMGCATPFSALYKEYHAECSKYKESHTVGDLFTEATFPHINHFWNIMKKYDKGVLFWGYDGPFYNADGHYFFDTITVVNEDVIYNVFYTPSFGFHLAMTSVLFGYITLRGEGGGDFMMIIDAPMAILFYYTPALIHCGIAGAGMGCAHIYDVALHDIPVLITKGISFPFVKEEEEKEEKKNLEPLELKYELVDNGTSITVLNVHYFPPTENDRHHIEAKIDLSSVFLDSIEYSRLEKSLSLSFQFKDKIIEGIEITMDLFDKKGNLIHTIPHFERQGKDRAITITFSLEKVPRLKEFKSAVILIKEIEKRPETESPPFINDNIF